MELHEAQELVKKVQPEIWQDMGGNVLTELKQVSDRIASSSMSSEEKDKAMQELAQYFLGVGIGLIHGWRQESTPETRRELCRNLFDAVLKAAPF